MNMIMIRLMGIILVLVCSFIIGEYMGLKLEFRRNQLSELRLGIGFLTGDIEFNLAPAAECAERISERLREPVRGIFKELGERLEGGESIERGWVRALTYNYDRTYLKAEDIEALYPLGKILECLDAEKQGRGIEVLNGYIDGKIKELEGELFKARRLYRSFSVLGGLFAVVVLL